MVMVGTIEVGNIFFCSVLVQRTISIVQDVNGLF